MRRSEGGGVREGIQQGKQVSQRRGKEGDLRGLRRGETLDRVTPGHGPSLSECPI